MSLKSLCLIKTLERYGETFQLARVRKISQEVIRNIFLRKIINFETEYRNRLLPIHSTVDKIIGMRDFECNAIKEVMTIIAKGNVNYETSRLRLTGKLGLENTSTK